MNVTLLGGWGYPNLGDEAILAGYLELLTPDHEVTVVSPDPTQTGHAQRRGISPQLISEYRSDEPTAGGGAAVVLCGGGYLNGHWKTEIRTKLRRLVRLSSAFEKRIWHAVEVRQLASSGSTRTLAEGLLESARVSVRDTASQEEVTRLGSPAAVVPDAIALLYPHLDRYATPIPELAGKILVNLQPLKTRVDPHDAHVVGQYWDDYCASVVEALGDRAIGLVGGGGDRKYMARFPQLPLIEPSSVSQLVSCVSSADGIFSLRMHPALLASMFDKPVCSVPYNGKIRPTLAELGLSGLIDPCTDLDDTMQRLESPSDWHDAWTSSHAKSADWLRSSLTL